MPNVLALALHVDYWDSIGWRDHFALPTAVRRQQQYVETLGLSSAFTPQVVVDGRSSFVGSDKRRILAAIAEPLNTIPISVEVARGVLTVSVPERQDRERLADLRRSIGIRGTLRFGSSVAGSVRRSARGIDCGAASFSEWTGR